MYITLSLSLSLSLSQSLFVYPAVCLFVCRSVFVYLFVCLSISVSQSVCACVSRFRHLALSLSFSLSFSLSLCLSPSVSLFISRSFYICICIHTYACTCLCIQKKHVHTVVGWYPFPQPSLVLTSRSVAPAGAFFGPEYPAGTTHSIGTPLSGCRISTGSVWLPLACVAQILASWRGPRPLKTRLMGSDSLSRTCMDSTRANAGHNGVMLRLLSRLSKPMRMHIYAYIPPVYSGVRLNPCACTYIHTRTHLRLQAEALSTRPQRKTGTKHEVQGAAGVGVDDPVNINTPHISLQLFNRKQLYIELWISRRVRGCLGTAIARQQALLQVCLRQLYLIGKERDGIYGPSLQWGGYGLGHAKS